ncbi:MAG TPA: M50 family metallopeptidase [Turneriella sp.]|nr:M50 family metallopeptidase [Turneriella sp.]
MKTVLLRILALGVLATLLIFFWDLPLLKPFKLFVVFLHETSHAMAALLTGGRLSAISIAWDESGATYTSSGEGIFFVIAIAGYIGSILWGQAMLRASLSGRYVRTVSVVVGLTVIFFGFFPDGDGVAKNSDKLLKYGISGIWGLSLILSAFLLPRFNHVLLFFLGGLTALYSLYDLNDFIHGDVMRTDAGILAHYLLGSSFLVKPMAYIIAGFISAISIYIFWRLVRSTFHVEEEYDDEKVDLAEWQEQNPDIEITPEMLAWLKDKAKHNSRE